VRILSTSYNALSVCIFIIILSASACSSNKEKKEEKAGGKSPGSAISKVNAYIVKNSLLSDNLELPGSVIANESTALNPEISGRLVYLNISEGKTVNKGTLLAKLYDGDLVAQLNKLKVQVKVAEQTSKRYEQLLQINGISQQEYDLSKLSISNLLADIEIVKSNIMRTEIKAPFNGTLGLKNISPGAFVTPQTIITHIRQNSLLKLDFTLPEKYSGQIKIGQLVHFSAEGSSKNYAAKIIAAESAMEEANRSLQVRSIITNNDGKLLPGQFVKVFTDFPPNPLAIMIPSQAVIPQARGKKVAVYQNGIATFESVTTGARDSANVQITKGLKVGDTIITTGLMGLKPGGKVQISKIIH
jgi:membrane fusion protein (multidrug efflux system)